MTARELAAILTAVVAVGVAVTTGAMYQLAPRVEVQRVEVPGALPARPSLKQFRRMLEGVTVIEDNYVMSPDGRPFYCALTDSTFSPDTTEGIRWQAQYCWQVTAAEAKSAGPKG